VGIVGCAELDTTASREEQYSHLRQIRTRSHAYSKTTHHVLAARFSTKLLLCRADVLLEESPASAHAYPQAHPARWQAISVQPIQPRQQGPMHHKRKIVDDKERRQNKRKIRKAPHEIFVHTRSVLRPGYHIADPPFRLLVQRVRRRTLAEEEMRLPLCEIENCLREDGVCPCEPGSCEKRQSQCTFHGYRCDTY